MRRLGRLAAGALVLAGTLNVAVLASPRHAFACSCVATGPEQIGTFKDDPNAVVFVGVVVSMSNIPDGAGHSTGVLEFQRVYKGDVPAARVPVVSGGGGDCTMALTAGQRMITAASIEGGIVTPHLCAPFGDPAMPDGQALVQAAVAAYGPGAAPPGGEAPVPAPTPPDPVLPIVLGAVLIGALVLIGLMALFARRGRTSG